MMRTLLITLSVFVVALANAAAQVVVTWNPLRLQGGDSATGPGFSSSATYNWDASNLWTRAEAAVWWLNDPSVTTTAHARIVASQTGSIISSGNYNSLKVWGRITHHASAQITFFNGQLTQYYRSLGTVRVDSHNGGLLSWERESSVPWGTGYTPRDGWFLLADIPNWNQSPVELYRESTSQARCSRTGINLLAERVETTVSILVEGYNR